MFLTFLFISNYCYSIHIPKVAKSVASQAPKGVAASQNATKQTVSNQTAEKNKIIIPSNKKPSIPLKNNPQN